MNTRTSIAVELLKGLLTKEAVEGCAAEDEIIGKALRMADILIRKGSGGTAAEPGRPMSVRESVVRTVSSLVRKCGPVNLVDGTGKPTLTAFRFGTGGVRTGVYALTTPTAKAVGFPGGCRPPCFWMDSAEPDVPRRPVGRLRTPFAARVFHLRRSAARLQGKVLSPCPGA